MKKKIASIGIAIAMMLGVNGCMEPQEKNNEEMLAHMYEKYGVEFEIQSYIPQNVDCSYDVWFCNAKDNDPELDKIEVHKYSKDEYIDNYYTRLVREEIEKRAMDVILQVAEEGKVYLSTLKYAEEEYTMPDQLDEFLQTDRGQYAFGMMVYIMDREKEGIKNQDVIDKLQAGLLEGGVGKPRVRVFFIKNDEIYQQIDRETHLDMIYWSGEKQIYTNDYSGNISDGLTK